MRVIRVAALAALAVLAAAAASAQTSSGGAYQMQQPKGTWQTPGQIQQPSGPWQKPGDIQMPKGIEAVHAEEQPCARRLSVLGDALFDFDKSVLRGDAEETLTAVGPEITKAGAHPLVIEGHTDAIGTDTYNNALSLRRAESVRQWLSSHRFVPVNAAVKGYGKTAPVAPNTKPDGGDDPEGRQKNRRVDIVIDTCH
jgi:outer membrane protein OmpA-like peptidoglycan-associated protein